MGNSNAIEIDFLWRLLDERYFLPGIETKRVVVKNSCNDDVESVFSLSRKPSLPLEIHMPQCGEIVSSEDGKMLFRKYPDGDVVLVLCLKQERAVVPNGVKYIGERAFCNSDVRFVELPDSVVKIIDYAFFECQYLEEIRLSKNLRAIGHGAFKKCFLLRSLRFGDSLEKIGQSAFMGCVNLSHVELGNSVRYIEESAFESCDKLKDISLPASLESLGEYAFPCLDNIRLEKMFPDFCNILDAYKNSVASKTPFFCIEYCGRKLIIPKNFSGRGYTLIMDRLNSIRDLPVGIHALYKIAITPRERFEVAMEGFRMTRDPETGEFLRLNLLSFLKHAPNLSEEKMIEILDIFDEKHLIPYEPLDKLLNLAHRNGWMNASARLLKMSADAEGKKDDLFQI